MVCPQRVRAGWARGQAARRAIDTGSYPVVSVPEPAWEGSRGRNPCGNRCRTRTKAQSSIGFPVAGHEERFTVPFGDGPWAVSALAGVKGAPKELTELSLGAKEAHPNPGKAWFGRRKQGKSPFVTTKSKIDRSTAAGVCSFSHMHPALEHSVLARARSRVHPVLACGLKDRKTYKTERVSTQPSQKGHAATERVTYCATKKSRFAENRALHALAERERFELSYPRKGKRFSRPPHSAALPPLQRMEAAPAWDAAEGSGGESGI